MSLPTPKKYQRKKTLGSGASGVIDLVKDKKDGELYVLKTINMAGFKQHQIRNAMNEVSVVALLAHPNIVAHHESFVEKDILYMAMEYAELGDLDELCNQKKKNGEWFTEEEILSWFTQLALAMKHCHDRSVLHRDLKPHNVFMCEDGTLKLGDFGFAMVLKESQSAQGKIGTPYYMSPEMVKETKYNAKSDIWSLGCVLFKMAALRVPFHGNDWDELQTNICTKHVPGIPKKHGYSSNIAKLIKAMLKKEARDRPDINKLLTVPFLRSRAKKLLPPAIYDAEFSHGTLDLDTGFGNYIDEDSTASEDSYTGSSDNSHYDTTYSGSDDYSSDDDDETSESGNDELAPLKAPPLRSAQDIIHSERAFGVLSKRYAKAVGPEAGTQIQVQNLKRMRRNSFQAHSGGEDADLLAALEGKNSAVSKLKKNEKKRRFSTNSIPSLRKK